MGIPFRFETAQTFQVSRAGPARIDLAAKHDDGHDSTEHVCSECQACCIHLPIPAGEVCANAKSAGVKCPHLADHGCQIYQVRPTTCRQFQCAWITESSWSIDWRPDRSGLLCLREEIDTGVSAALVYEIQRNAIASPTTELILAKLKESTAVVALVNRQRQRRLLRGHQWVELGERPVGPPHFLRPIHAIGTQSPESLRDAS